MVIHDNWCKGVPPWLRKHIGPLIAIFPYAIIDNHHIMSHKFLEPLQTLPIATIIKQHVASLLLSHYHYYFLLLLYIFLFLPLLLSPMIGVPTIVTIYQGPCYMFLSKYIMCYVCPILTIFPLFTVHVPS